MVEDFDSEDESSPPDLTTAVAVYWCDDRAGCNGIGFDWEGRRWVAIPAAEVEAFENNVDGVRVLCRAAGVAARCFDKPLLDQILERLESLVDAAITALGPLVDMAQDMRSEAFFHEGGTYSQTADD